MVWVIRKVALFPSLSVSPASVSHVYSHIVGSGWSCPTLPTLPRWWRCEALSRPRIVCGLGKGEAGWMPAVSLKVLAWNVVPCVYTLCFTCSEIIGRMEQLPERLWGTDHWLSFRIQSMNAATKQFEFELQLWPGGQFMHQCSVWF